MPEWTSHIRGAAGRAAPPPHARSRDRRGALAAPRAGVRGAAPRRRQRRRRAPPGDGRAARRPRRSPATCGRCARRNAPAPVDPGRRGARCSAISRRTSAMRSARSAAARLRRRRHPHPGARHRRQQRHLRAGRRHAAPPAADSRARARGDDLGAHRRRPPHERVSPEQPARFRRAQPQLRRHRAASWAAWAAW